MAVFPRKITIKEDKKWYEKPLIIALFSNFLFALIVGGLIATLQHWNWKKQEAIANANRIQEQQFNLDLQHQTWKKQEEIQREKTFQELLFRKKSEIIEKFYYLEKLRMQNVYNAWHSFNDEIEALERKDKVAVEIAKRNNEKYRSIDQELIGQYSSLIGLGKVYCLDDLGIVEDIIQAGEIWHHLYYKLPKEILSETYVNCEINRAEEVCKRIRLGFMDK